MWQKNGQNLDVFKKSSKNLIMSTVVQIPVVHIMSKSNPEAAAKVHSVFGKGTKDFFYNKN